MSGPQPAPGRLGHLCSVVRPGTPISRFLNGLWANPNQDFGILRSNSHFRVVLKGKPKGKELMFGGSLKTRYPHIVKLLEPSDCKSSSFVASPVGSRMASYMATSICLISFVISLWWLKESSTSGNIFCIFPRGLSKWRTI